MNNLNLFGSKFNHEDLRNHETSAGIIINDKGEYCIQDHVKHNMLTFPIGKIKPSETPLDGLKTEMSEELGIEVLKAKELFTYDKEYNFDGNNIKIKTHVFIIENYKGNIQNKESKKHRWIKFMKLEDVINSGRKVADCVQQYFNSKFYYSKKIINFSERIEKLRMKLQLAQYELQNLIDKEKELSQKPRTLDQITKYNYKKDIANKKIQITQSRLNKAMEDETIKKSKKFYNDRLDKQLLDKYELQNDYKLINQRQKLQKKGV